jgi:hypothetical protein
MATMRVAIPIRLVLGILIVLTLLSRASAAQADTDFGVAPGSFAVSLSTFQAGAHPDLQSSFTFNQNPANVPVGRLKDVEFDLPAGLTGSPTFGPTCPMSQLVAEPPSCPLETAVGVAHVTIGTSGSPAGSRVVTSLIYNVVPYKHEPAAFAFVSTYPVRLDASLRSNGDDGIHIAASNVTEAVPLLAISITFWGVPAEHDAPGPEVDGRGTSYGARANSAARPLMTNPSICGVGLSSGLTVRSWPELNDQGEPVPSQTASATASTPALTGCDRLNFGPSLLVRPETFQADAPSGYELDIHVPQSPNPVNLATPDLRDAVVTLPQGTVVSPSAADGLQSCTEAQVGLHTLQPTTCPQAATIGSAEIDTPVLPNPLMGSIYLARQDENPFGAFLAVYVVVEGSGVLIKLAGEVHLDPTTGQLTTRFLSNPQLPISDLKLNFKGGPRSLLANPSNCGLAQSSTALTPWSGTQPAIASSSFNVSSDGGGTCPSPAPFTPAFSSGTVDPSAGAFSPLTLTLAREDGQQEFGAIQLRTPPGLLAKLSSVRVCPEPQASGGTCGPESLIGHTTFGVGPGPHPFYIAGNAFLTGPYKGAPFGLSLVLHAVAGPFDLGIVIIRAAISVDPQTAALTITSDPFPQILRGIPLQLKVINITIDRPGFVFNPTNCAGARAVDATVSGTQGANTAVASPFAATGCTKLPFSPSFSASSSARTSRATGASLKLDVRFPAGRQANIARVDISLPKLMPSRLTTIEHACLAVVFNANPARCPAASVVGTGHGFTPVLSETLNGPIYLVSHGGKADPALVVLLQADGVRIDLSGEIRISKAGVTSSTFDAVPDAPISSFELNLPRSSHSVLTSTGNMCAKPLLMPTTITAQNGAVIKQSTRIKVADCPKRPKTGKASNAKRRKGTGK